MKSTYGKLLALPLLIVSFSFAGTSFAQDTTTPTTPSSTQMKSGDMSSMISESEIAEILKTANDAEIDAAKAAKSRASSSQVKDFAKHMETEHESNNKEAKSVLKKADIKMKSNEMAKTLKKDSKEQLSQLKKKKGADFDSAYIENQISMHQQLLSDLEQKFIPSAKNPEFKSFLEKTKTHVQQHLSKAQEVQQSMTK
ncbi:DUF4142 domain-containing protein [Bdellovibrio sp. 22V]|uniref:DUF4142 domain-containing protein n=1 Tax=Bdellovibrio TaxID=958 RepID=UPI0025430150|nr:DUF4142 domain-containing protein [Bdellovibrio sp. 22V]WII73115.1 DUF4142 domain-containing protein [Bdellovibrio sp. 22V]